VEWGILTNGRLWRLYHKDTAHKQDRFSEVDLPALVEANDAEAFLSFSAFFHRSAFEPGPVSLGALLKESAAYARSVELHHHSKHAVVMLIGRYPTNPIRTSMRRISERRIPPPASSAMIHLKRSIRPR
jgi:hypothetical protein